MKDKLQMFAEMTAIEMTADHLPLVKTIEIGIKQAETLIELLNKRKAIALDPKQMLSEYEINERKILMIKTDIDLASHHTKLYQKKDYLLNYKNGILGVLREIATSWEDVMQSATVLAEAGNTDVKEMLSKFDEKSFLENWELLVNFYVTLKELCSKSSKDKKDSELEPKMRVLSDAHKVPAEPNESYLADDGQGGANVE